MAFEKFTFFWSGPFSQWHRRGFVLDGIEFNTAEQFMMFQKAHIFGDAAIALEIMDTSDPRKQKDLGRKVKNFNVEVWNANAKMVVYRGSMAKYGQNPDLLTELRNTKGTTIVEASPDDTIWGIGLGADDPRAQSRDTWLGTNWLGEILTLVRDDLS
jgi:ribA/ribD-fused uncharacterized protein